MMNKKFVLEQAVFQIKTLLSIMADVNGGTEADTWKEDADRIYVLLEAMEPIVNELYEYVLNGGQ